MSRRPRTGIVDRGGICVQPSRSQKGVSSTQTSWSVWPSGWQLSHENVPVDEAPASWNAMRPRLMTAGVGSARVTVAATPGDAGVERSTSDTVLATAFRTQARDGAPPASDSRAMPRGTAPTAVRPSTSPLAASTVNSLSDPAAETTSVASSSLIAIANGVASASPAAGCAGGSGSSSMNSGSPHEPPPQSMRVIRFRKARFSSSASPSPSVPARPLASLRASAWATKTSPPELTASP